MRLSMPLMIAAAMAGVLSAQARRVTPPQEVATLDELRARTPDQVARSAIWAHEGRPLIETQRMSVSVQGMEDILLSPLHEMFVWGRDVCSSSAVVIGRPVFARTFQAHFIHRRHPMPVAGGMVITDNGRLRDQAAFFKSVSDLAAQCPRP